MRCSTLFLLVSNLGLCVGNKKPQKVAILGGGAASCTTTLALTGQSGWKERYNITIYQLGWRLGGKARSGRNKNYGQRVEEITGHDIPAVSFNMIRVLRSVYEELDRQEGSPLRTFEAAFVPSSIFGNTQTDIDCQTDNECLTIKMIKQMKIEQTEHWDEELLKKNSTLLKSKVKSVQKLL